MKYYLLLLLATTAIFISSCKPKQNTFSTIGLLEPNEFLQHYKTNGGLLVDVRTPSEFAEGSIPAAINIDYKANDFESKMNQLDKEKTLYLFCRRGGRSAAACSKAEGLGFKKVYDMKGGYLAYSKSK